MPTQPCLPGLLALTVILNMLLGGWYVVLRLMKLGGTRSKVRRELQARQERSVCVGGWGWGGGGAGGFVCMCMWGGALVVRRDFGLVGRGQGVGWREEKGGRELLWSMPSSTYEHANLKT